jgi:protein ImuB
VRVACLRVPDLPLAAALRAHPELAGRPLGIATGPGPRAELVSLSPQAARRGVRRGSSVAHARAACPELQVRIASPALESAARAALLDAALACAPRAALAPRSAGAWASEAAVFVDASGVGSLFRSEPGFAAALLAQAARLGLPGDAAVASSRSVALLAARQQGSGEAPGTGQVRVLAPGSEAEFLAPLPLDLLDPPDDLAQVLTRFGLRRVGQLLALPPRELGLRLGRAALALVALARGEEVETPLPVPAPAALAEAIDLELPVDRLEPLGFVLQGLLSRLLERLEARQLACGELRLALALEGGGREARRIGVAAPTLDLRVLMRLALRSLEASPPAGCVTSACLETEGAPLEQGQLNLFRPAGPAPAALGRTLNELEALCGSGRVGAPRVADEHRPGAFALAPFRPARGAGGGSAEPGVLKATDAASLALRALRPPVPAEVRLRGGRPVQVRSAVANGRVLAAAGPWRTTGGWWSNESRFAYDSFDVQTSDGTLARLRFDHRAGRWEIDAVYD